MANAYPIDRIRSDFPILKREVRSKALTYLDNAASTLKPTCVIDRLNAYYRNESSNVHRGAHFLAEQGTMAYESARETVRAFLNARGAEEIIFTRGTTESINLVASSYGRTFFDAGDEIILTELEHHSNIVPWQMIANENGCTIKVVPIDEVGDLNFEKYLELLGPRTKMVSLTWCSNTLGTVVDVARFVQAAHAVGAKVMVDAAQAVAQMKCDVTAIDCDFLALSGHKIFGPYGIGVLYAKSALLEAMPPYQGGGSMIAEVTWEKTTWAAIPHKFEAGTPIVAGALGLETALRYVNEIGLGAIHRHEEDLLQFATAQLSEIPGLKVFGHPKTKAGILSFGFDGIHASDIGSLLDQQGVAIRAGHHCCQPLMRALGVTATARASFSIYNTRGEVDVLKSSVLKAKELLS